MNSPHPAVDDRARLMAALHAAGVAGVDDFGRFVNNTTYFEPSTFDEQAAMPVLLAMLPSLNERTIVEATVRHLNRRWAKPVAFQPLLAAFEKWAANDHLLGWVIGDSLASAATAADLDVLLALAVEKRFGSARQMVVLSLWRFRKDPRPLPVLIDLIDCPDVALQAMSALRRTIGNDAALPHLQRTAETSPHDLVRRQAANEVRKTNKAISASDPATRR